MQAYKLSFPGHATSLIKNNKNIHAQGTVKAASAHSEINTYRCPRMSGTFSRSTNELTFFLNKGITEYVPDTKESGNGCLTTSL